MNIRLDTLTLQCRKSVQEIDLSKQITYFHGQISAGKSSIMRLIDYCLGGKLERTPAISQELVSVTLLVIIKEYHVLFERDARGTNYVQVTWRNSDGESATVSAPIKAGKDLIWENDIYNLSDLIFYLVGITPIKVRRSKIDEESPLIRLSFRDIMWYCYLDQDHLDSSFYRLKDGFRQMKSRDVMKFVTGLYTERMNELEIDLDQIRSDRRSKLATAKQIRQFLNEYGFGSEIDIVEKIETTRIELTDAKSEQQKLQQQHIAKTHVSDDLKDELRNQSEALSKDKEALFDLDERINEQEKLKAELVSSKFKLAKINTASNILSNVQFESCPACGKRLKNSSTTDICYLCKSSDIFEKHEEVVPQADIVNKDLNSRIDDLSISIERHKKARKSQIFRVKKLTKEKEALDNRLNDELANYDSAYVTQSKEINHRVATLEERIRGLNQLKVIPKAINKLSEEAKELKIREEEIINEIDFEKSKLFDAELRIKDIERVYLSTLLRVGVPGIQKQDKILLSTRNWIPSILPPDGDSYSFYNAGSGGKKTLLNACYALSVHQVAIEYDLPLPRFLMIDTPMKNIGEDVNRDIFVAFYEYLYELASDKLVDMQFIIIDKEYLAPSPDVQVEVNSTFMDPEKNPLISNYRGA